MTEKSSHGSYSKDLTISIETVQSNIKFFYNSSFRTRLQEYTFDTYGVECQIRLLETQEVLLTLTGIKSNVKTAREAIRNLFKLIVNKIYDNEDTDQQMIHWSQRINSDLIVPVIQKIMDDHNMFTLWRKTAMFYGHLSVSYFTNDAFPVSQERITDILKDEIMFVESISMPSEKTNNMLKSIDQYIFNKQSSDIAIIRTKYPYKSDIKISLFGRKSLVKKARKNLQSIISKHTIKRFSINMDADQFEYLLDHCTEQLKDIENDFTDDSVKIRLRQNEFQSPHYLIEKIKQRVKGLIFQTVIYQFEKVGNPVEITDDNNHKFQCIAEYNYCRIEKIETKTEIQIYPIPKALAQLPSTSRSIIQQSNKFSSSLCVRRIFVPNGSIGIFLTDQNISIPRDVTIISSPAGAAEENIEFASDNGFSEMKSGRKFLFYRWSPSVFSNESSKRKLKKTIEKFISSTLQNVQVCFNNVQTIAFTTNEWENVGDQKEFVNTMINQVKQEIEIAKANWRVIFFFNNQQVNIYKEFHEFLIQLQTDEDGYAQFLTPISKVQITLTTTSNFDLRKCKKELENYVQKYIIVNTTMDKQTDMKQWDQHMINAFYKYCLDSSVLPTLNLTSNSSINLVGPLDNVHKAIEKCKLMNEVLRQKLSFRIPPPATPRVSLQRKHSSRQSTNDNFNIYFSYCQHDKDMAGRIADCLTGEGYTVCETSLDGSSHQSYIDMADVILIAFSAKYSKNKYLVDEINDAKLKGKQLVPFAIQNRSKSSCWLSSLALAESFYDLFDTEINVQFNHDFDFDFEYDKLLLRLYTYTKPGTTGKLYPQAAALPDITSNHDDYEEAAFGYRSAALQKITPAQRSEHEKKYQAQITDKIENEKIPDDEIDDLQSSLRNVASDIESILRGEDVDGKMSEEADRSYSRGYKTWELNEIAVDYLREFLDCVKRWLARSPNVIKGNIKPFTPTGDINDAIFVIPQSSIDQIVKRTYEPFEYSEPKKYFSSFESNPGSWFTNEQSENYLQKLIESTKPGSDMILTLGDEEMAWDTVSINQGNTSNDEDDIEITDLKTPEEIQKLEKLDNPNRIWKKPRVSMEFIQQKIKNILELKQLCAKSQ